MTMARGFTGALPPRRLNMARYVIAAAAARTPDKTALLVVDAGDGGVLESWRYDELERGVLAVAAGLAGLGLEPRSRILIRLENTSAYVLAFFGAIAAGHLPIPTSSQLTDAEGDFLLEDSGAAAVAAAETIRLPRDVRRLTPAMIAAWIETGAAAGYTDTHADDPAYLVYTSGTTSRPKGVLHAQRAAWGRRPMYEGWYGLAAEDRLLHAGAFNWTYTLGTGLTDPWVVGATAIVVLGEKDPARWPALIRATGATIFAAVPQVYRQILKYAGGDVRDLGPLRHGLMAGEAPPPGLVEAWQERTGTALYEAIGMSEMSTFVSSSPTVPRRPGRIGRPQPGRCVAVLPVECGTEPLPAGEEGLMAVHRSDPGLMLGYWHRPAEEAQVMRGEWFIGGDLAVMDADGYVEHRGRANDIMKAMGYRVAPQEVEAAIAQHPAVAEVGCAEVRVRGELSVIGAFIVPRPGCIPAPEEIREFAARSLAPYKCPRHVELVASLPRTANGKLKRSALVPRGGRG